jgi:predicted transcriptional regulator
MKKKLVVSIKTPAKAFEDFKKAYNAVSKKNYKGAHFEISFNSKKDFDRFVKNIGILSLIKKLKPKSVYELAKIAEMDVSNLNKIILFFEEAGVIKVVRKKVAGRTVTMPLVEYDKIEFDLAA